jgi:hypothetical protein
MHTICETHAFQRAAAEAGMTRDEIDAVVDYLAGTPDAGDAIQGTGGCRKVRVAGKGRGKSGGYRVITFFSGFETPVFLLTVFAKNERANLTKAERNALAVLTEKLLAEYRRGTTNGAWRK